MHSASPKGPTGGKRPGTRGCRKVNQCGRAIGHDPCDRRVHYGAMVFPGGRHAGVQACEIPVGTCLCGEIATVRIAVGKAWRS
jgi:hypothetical protein